MVQVLGPLSPMWGDQEGVPGSLAAVAFRGIESTDGRFLSKSAFQINKHQQSNQIFPGAAETTGPLPDPWKSCLHHQ